MSGGQPIVRIAAKGDGVAQDGRHFAMTAPGDTVELDGTISPGPHRATPPCEHFGRCGGCQLQHCDNEVLRRFVRDRVVNAANGQGIEVGELHEVHLSPPKSRRRAGLHALKVKSGAIIGYREAGSHRLVDLKHCPVLTSDLASLIDPLRQLVGAHGNNGNIDLTVTLCDQGVDLDLSQFALEDLEVTEAVLEFAKAHSLARLTVNQGFGPETLWEPEPATVSLSGIPVGLPAGAFLQATPDAETCMLADCAEWLGDAQIVADLFSGLGTFAFALARGNIGGRKVLAVEAEQASHLACKAASVSTRGKMIALHRDLFRNPLQSVELSRFDAVVLDPPRAGAKAQVAEIAASDLARVVYVSCNPSSWARDGAALVEAGFTLKRLRPVGQFRWSTHVELVSLFER